ncbi:uncharacterized protein LOC131269420 isoform X2 [Anopheles coustani]|uniref:uncharacterized protein LOC131269420 isoform X2 n=1 Tax=Anopheles coustani TaxID=139045 RepID=UPI0026584350|nr:uncharacterized protein LOC131269420 isoform X2 [Anopheles coustani]
MPLYLNGFSQQQQQQQPVPTTTTNTTTTFPPEQPPQRYGSGQQFVIQHTGQQSARRALGSHIYAVMSAIRRITQLLPAHFRPTVACEGEDSSDAGSDELLVGDTWTDCLPALCTEAIAFNRATLHWFRTAVPKDEGALAARLDNCVTEPYVKALAGLLARLVTEQEVFGERLAWLLQHLQDGPVSRERLTEVSTTLQHLAQGIGKLRSEFKQSVEAGGIWGRRRHLRRETSGGGDGEGRVDEDNAANVSLSVIDSFEDLEAHEATTNPELAPLLRAMPRQVGLRLMLHIYEVRRWTMSIIKMLPMHFRPDIVTEICGGSSGCDEEEAANIANLMPLCAATRVMNWSTVSWIRDTTPLTPGREHERAVDILGRRAGKCSRAYGRALVSLLWRLRTALDTFDEKLAWLQWSFDTLQELVGNDRHDVTMRTGWVEACSTLDGIAQSIDGLRRDFEQMEEGNWWRWWRWVNQLLPLDGEQERRSTEPPMLAAASGTSTEAYTQPLEQLPQQPVQQKPQPPLTLEQQRELLNQFLLHSMSTSGTSTEAYTQPLEQPFMPLEHQRELLDQFLLHSQQKQRRQAKKPQWQMKAPRYELLLNPMPDGRTQIVVNPPDVLNLTYYQDANHHDHNYLHQNQHLQLQQQQQQQLQQQPQQQQQQQQQHQLQPQQLHEPEVAPQHHSQQAQQPQQHHQLTMTASTATTPPTKCSPFQMATLNAQPGVATYN